MMHPRLQHFASLPASHKRMKLLDKITPSSKYRSIEHSSRQQNMPRYKDINQQQHFNKRKSIGDLFVPQFKKPEKNNTSQSISVRKNTTQLVKLASTQLNAAKQRLSSINSAKNKLLQQKKPYFAPIQSKGKIKINSFKPPTSTIQYKRSPPKATQTSSQNSLPKYLHFREESVQNEIIEQVALRTQIRVQRQSPNPQLLKSYLHQNSLPSKIMIGQVQRVRDMNVNCVSPSLVPITSQNASNNISSLISIQWVRQEYRPHLEVLELRLSSMNLILKRYQKGVYVGQSGSKLHLTQQNDEKGEEQVTEVSLGIVFYKSGKIYEGYFENGQKHGSGFEKYPDGSSYLGGFNHGRRQGRGKFEWANGEVYDGEWKRGKKQGSGIWKGPQGVSYVGEWSEDAIEGFGVLVENQERYEGQFKNFLKQGKGKYQFKNKQIYIGSFIRNLPYGVGEYHWTNGDVYRGQFMHGKRHGKGTLVSGKETQINFISYRGQFNNDKKCGEGQQIYDGNMLYIGTFQNDFRHGWGALYSSEVRIFQGYWLNNRALDTNHQFKTIIQQEYNNCVNSNFKNNQNRKKIFSKQEEMSRLAFKVFKGKSPNKQIEIKPFKRVCQCSRHRDQ